MTNIYWNFKQNNKKVLVMLEISFYNHGFITKENFYKFNCKNQKQPPEVFWKKDVFLEISQNSQEKTCARASFLIEL